VSNRSIIAVIAAVTMFTLFPVAACSDDTASPFSTTTPVPAGDASALGNSGKGAAAGPDIANGESKFSSLGCNGCQSTGTNKQVGPGLAGIGSRGDDYIRTSIIDPSAVIVGDYSDLMPKSFASLKESDLVDLIAYLKTLG
jgi:cytochrome c2